MKLRYPALAVTVLIFAALEVAARILPLEYTTGAGIFLTEHRKALVESNSPEFDYIILGDSRSLSLRGHPPTKEEPFSVYNLSLPAMGARYFPYYLDKYFEKRGRLPAAIIFAGDPGLFQKTWSVPNHDQGMLYAEELDESLAQYLSNRFTKRLHYLKEGRYPDQRDPFGLLVWEAFSHRYLHLFDLPDMIRQYRGAERIFMVRESIPNILHLYRFREGIRQYTVDLRANSFRKHPLPAYCSSCSHVTRLECHPDLPKIEDNQLLEAQLAESYGQVNLGNRLTIGDRFKYYQLRDSAIDYQVKFFQKQEPDMRHVEAIVRKAAERGVRIVFSDVPAVEPMRGVHYHQVYFEKMKELEKRYPNMKVIRFPDPYYPVKLFIEQVHYECEGAERLSSEFYSHVMPQILRFAPPEKQ
jgi:hypothetical protein